LIGRIVDLDILSLFPQKDSRDMEGLRRIGSHEGQEWRRKHAQELVKGWGTIGEDAPLIRSPENLPLWDCVDGPRGLGLDSGCSRRMCTTIQDKALSSFG
jgi:hypothetical protein